MDPAVSLLQKLMLIMTLTGQFKALTAVRRMHKRV